VQGFFRRYSLHVSLLSVALHVTSFKGENHVSSFNDSWLAIFRVLLMTFYIFKNITWNVLELYLTNCTMSLMVIKETICFPFNHWQIKLAETIFGLSILFYIVYLKLSVRLIKTSLLVIWNFSVAERHQTLLLFSLNFLSLILWSH
jgi:hypothetical protein